MVSLEIPLMVTLSNHPVVLVKIASVIPAKVGISQPCPVIPAQAGIQRARSAHTGRRWKGGAHLPSTALLGWQVRVSVTCCLLIFISLHGLTRPRAIPAEAHASVRNLALEARSW